MHYFFDSTEMAGVKRKVEATLESAAPLERSDGHDPDTRSPSRATTRNRSTQGHARGKLTSSARGRGVPLASPNTAPAEESDTHRAKRARKTSPIQESPRPTRQSARLLNKTRANSSPSPEAPNQEPVNNPKLTATTRPRNRAGVITRSRNAAPADVKTEPPRPRLKLTLFTKPSNFPTTTDRQNTSHKPENTARRNDNTEDNSLTRSTNKHKSSKANTVHGGSRTSTNDKALKAQGRAERVPMTSKDGTGLEFKITPTASGTKKRKKAGIEDENTDNLLSAPVHSNKKLKLGHNAPAKGSKSQLQNGTENDHSWTAAIGLEVSGSGGSETSNPIAAVESGQPTTEAKTSNVQLTIPPAASRGRGTGRGRGRGRRRGRGPVGGGWRGGNSRGRGGGGRGGARGVKRTEDDSDIARSPSPCPATQKLRERQKELDKAFKKVAAAQRLALAVLATNTQKQLLKKKNAHVSASEHTQIEKDLETFLLKRQDILHHEYELKVKHANILFKANKDLLETQFRASALHIQEEHLLAAQGEYMAFVEGHCHAEDEDHTESEESGIDSEEEHCLFLHDKKFKRGFNSSFVRDLEGATAFERANSRWDDFVQRVKLGGDIDPQMKKMDEVAAQPAAEDRQDLQDRPDMVGVLLEATAAMEARQGTILAVLADVATARINPIQQEPVAMTTPRLSNHRTILPQPAQPQPQAMVHGPTDPRSFILPRPEPRPTFTPQMQQPRRLLPAQIPPINEQLSLPDPFAGPGGAPPQLPPPQGANFSLSGPITSYLGGPPIYYHPPPPPPPRPSPPGHLRPY
ncbi:hypothetical protein V8E54_009328 [Elaphomyces granulatus]